MHTCAAGAPGAGAVTGEGRAPLGLLLPSPSPPPSAPSASATVLLSSGFREPPMLPTASLLPGAPPCTHSHTRAALGRPARVAEHLAFCAITLFSACAQLWKFQSELLHHLPVVPGNILTGTRFLPQPSLIPSPPNQKIPGSLWAFLALNCLLSDT